MASQSVNLINYISRRHRFIQTHLFSLIVDFYLLYSLSSYFDPRPFFRRDLPGLNCQNYSHGLFNTYVSVIRGTKMNHQFERYIKWNETIIKMSHSSLQRFSPEPLLFHQGFPLSQRLVFFLFFQPPTAFN